MAEVSSAVSNGHHAAAAAAAALAGMAPTTRVLGVCATQQDGPEPTPPAASAASEGVDGGTGGAPLEATRSGISDEGSVGSTPSVAGSSKGWELIRRKLLPSVELSMQLRTLREMYSECVLDPDRLHFEKTLGEGSHGRVDKYSYTEKNGMKTAIAVKRLKSSITSAQGMLDFMKEVDLLKKLSHECIAGYRGSGTIPSDKEGEEDDLYLAQECLEGGTLRELLQEQMQHRHPQYTLLEACRWLRDVARGLSYLHRAEPVVVHRDLKLENIMLAKDRRAKLVDFGLHKVIDRWERQAAVDENGLYEMTGGTGAYVYMAPESFTSNRYNHLVDVYAFGIIMWELMHYEMLIYRISYRGASDEVRNFAKYVAKECWRPPISASLPKGIANLIAECWAQEPKDRPESADVVVRLRNIISELEAEQQAETNKRKELYSTSVPDYDTHPDEAGKGEGCFCFRFWKIRKN